MQMTFDQYIVNPMGKENSVFSNKEMYRKLYREKFDKILLREAGKIKYKLFISMNKYYAHIKVPSEVVPNFYYDTVIEFYESDMHCKLKRDLKDYNVKFYSNDPSFVYTFAHAFAKNDLFIKDLLVKMDPLSLKQAATVKNPKNEVGYVKSLYFAYLTMQKYGLFNKIKFEVEATAYNSSKLLSDVVQAELKVAQRQEMGESISKKKKISKIDKVEGHNRFQSNDSSSTKIQPSKTIGKTTYTNKSGYSKKTKRTK